MGSNPFRDKLLTVGVLGRRTRDEVREGREHPDSGLPFKATTDELGNVVTEHGERGSAVSSRQDVEINLRPVVVKAQIERPGG